MPPWGRSTFKSVRRSLQTEPTVASLRQQITSSGRGKLCFRASLGDDPDPGQPLGVPHLIARLSPRSPFCELAAAQQRNNKTAANTSRTLSISAILSATPSRSTTVETRQPCRRTMEKEKKRKARQTNETTPPPPTHKSPSPEGRREPRRDRDVYRSVAPDEQPLDILKAGLCQCHCHGRLAAAAAFPTTATTACKNNRTTGCDEQRTGAAAAKASERRRGS